MTDIVFVYGNKGILPNLSVMDIAEIRGVARSTV
jgi:hypothetical protein